jgi:hypothetical protein
MNLVFTFHLFFFSILPSLQGKKEVDCKRQHFIYIIISVTQIVILQSSLIGFEFRSYKSKS